MKEPRRPRTAKRRVRSSVGSLSDVLKAIDEGRSQDIPAEITLRTDRLEKSDVVALLELIRHRSFGPGFAEKVARGQTAAALPPEFVPALQRCRSLLESGNFSRAVERVDQERSDDPELLVQRVRANCFLGRFREAREDADRLLVRSDLLPSTRGVAHQLKGQCLMEQGDFMRAGESLETALEIAQSLGNRLGLLSARLFLSKLRCLSGAPDRAVLEFEAAREQLSPSDESFRWLLGFYRTWSFLRFAQGDPECLNKALIALLLAESLEDRVYSARTRIEAALMGRSLGLISQADALRLAGVSDEASGDLPDWRLALSGSRVPAPCASLTYFLGRAERPWPTKSSSKSARLLAGASDPGRYAWVLDAELCALIDLEKKGHRALKAEGPLVGMMAILSGAPTALPMEQVFEQAWSLRWNEAIHLNTLSVALSRLSAGEPSYAIRRKDNALSLSRPGIVFSKLV